MAEGVVRQTEGLLPKDSLKALLRVMSKVLHRRKEKEYRKNPE